MPTATVARPRACASSTTVWATAASTASLMLETNARSLEDVDGQAPEVAKRRAPRAAVVDRDPNAHRAQVAEQRNHDAGAVHEVVLPDVHDVGGEEVARWDDPPLRMRPEDQGFEAGDPSRLGLHDGLVVDGEPDGAVDGPADLRPDLEQPARSRVPVAEPLACILLVDHSVLISVSLVAVSRTISSTFVCSAAAIDRARTRADAPNEWEAIRPRPTG
jgi:hypothetical protein